LAKIKFIDTFLETGKKKACYRVYRLYLLLYGDRMVVWFTTTCAISAYHN